MFPRRIQAAFHTQFLHGIDEAKTVHDDTDGTDQAGLVRINFIGGGGDVITAGCANVGDHGIDFDLGMFTTQAFDLVINIARLHRTATRTVYPQDNTGGILVVEGIAQAVNDIVGAGISTGGNYTFNLDQ